MAAKADDTRKKDLVDTVAIPDDEDEDLGTRADDRNKDYSKQKKIREQLDKIVPMIEKAFEDKIDQAEMIQRCWDIYDCELNEQQAYLGSSQIYIPIVKDAIEARVTRFVGQMFPQNGHYADVVSSDGTTPYDTIALLDHYAGITHLREAVVPALVRNGDISGQYNLFIDWMTRKRYVTKKVMRSELQAEDGTEIAGGDEYQDIKEEEIEEGAPDIIVLDTRDLVVLPASCDSIEDAEHVVIALWMTEGKVKKLRDADDFDKDAADELLDNFGMADTRPQQVDTNKKSLASAGVKTDSKGSKRALIYQVWSTLTIGGEKRRCVWHYAGANLYLSCKRNPFWNDRVPVLSTPLKKKPGSFWGVSPVAAVEKVQYQANDAVNIGMDSAMFSMLPIVMTDPEKNPRIGSMVLAMAAIWETNPNDTKFASFPQLWNDSMGIVSLCKDQIMQSLSTNPAMMPHAQGSKKPSQAEVAQQQQVSLESTADATAIIETAILSPLLQWYYDLDYQYRDKDITVRKYGQLGLQADMQQIPPLQDDTHYTFRWYGSESTKSAQQVQQMIAYMNVLRGVPPDQLNGRKLDISPMLEFGAEAVFGPRLAPKILIDQRDQQTVDPELENQLMMNSFPIHVHDADNDIQHIQAHQTAMLQGDPQGLIRQHILDHMMQMKAKEMKAQQAAQPKQPGAPGVPGGGPPGVPGSPPPGQPRIGAQPGQPRPVQQPPGAIGTDQMPLAMPRKAG